MDDLGARRPEMTDGLSFRELLPNEIGELTQMLHRAYERMARQGFNVTAVDQDVETTAERCEGGVCWIVEAEGRIVGTIKLNPPDPESLAPEFRTDGIAIVNQFGIDPEFSGRGIGGELHQIAKERAAAQGATAMLLDTVDGADSLVELYESWGYRIVGRVHWPGKNYQSHIMRLELT